MQHLNDEAAQLLGRNDPAAVLHFREHLAGACETCEQYLQTHEGAQLLDGLSDALLVHARELPPDDANYEQVRRKLRRRTLWPAWSAGLGLLASVLFVVVLSRIPSPPPATDVGLKGAQHVELELQLAWQPGTGDVSNRPTAIQRVEQGGTVPADGRLLFRYHVTENVRARLLRQRAREKAPVILGELPLEAGTHDLALNHTVLGVDLSDEKGPTTFILETVPDHGEPVRARATVVVGD